MSPQPKPLWNKWFIIHNRDRKWCFLQIISKLQMNQVLDITVAKKLFNPINLPWTFSLSHQAGDISRLGLCNLEQTRCCHQSWWWENNGPVLGTHLFLLSWDFLLLFYSTPIPSFSLTSRTQAHIIPSSCTAPCHPREPGNGNETDICRFILITWNRWCRKWQVSAILNFLWLFLKMQKQQKN